MSERRAHQVTLALREVVEDVVVDAVSMAVFPTTTTFSLSLPPLDGSLGLDLRGKIHASPSSGGKTFLGSESRSIMSPTQHKDGRVDDDDCDASVNCFGV